VAFSRPAARLALGAALVAPLAITLPAQAEPAPKVQFVRVNFFIPGSDQDGEYIVIRNTTRQPIELKKWFLRDTSGVTYTFGDVTLGPRKRLTIRSGKGKDTSAVLYWGLTSSVWDNQDTASLYNAALREVDSCSWEVSPTTRTEHFFCL